MDKLGNFSSLTIYIDEEGPGVGCGAVGGGGGDPFP